MPVFQEEDARRMAMLWAAANAFPEPDAAKIRLVWKEARGLPGPFLDKLALQEGDADELAAEPLPAPAAAPFREAPVAAKRTGPAAGIWMKYALMGAGALTLVLMLLFQSDINQWLNGPQNAQMQDAALASRPRTELALPATTTEQPAITPATAAEAETKPAAFAAETQALAVQKAPESAAPASTQVAQTGSEHVVSKTVSNTVAAASPALNTKPAKASANSAADNKPVAEIAAAPNPAKEKSTTATLSKSSQASSVPQETAGLSEDEQELMAAKGTAMAVQVLAATEEKAMGEFIQQYGLSKARYYRSLRGGKPWYVLVLPFPDRATAEAARDALPEAVRAQGPWLKSLAAIQQEIRNRKP